MNFLLPHPTDVLLMNASKRNGVLPWSERQAGIRARGISVPLGDEPFADEAVKKSGTGIRG